MAGRPGRRIEPGSIVFHDDGRATILRPRAQTNRSAFTPRRHRVLDAVLDERLQAHARHQHRAGDVAEIDGVAQPIAEPHALDVEVRAQHAQFLVERHERIRGAVERRTQQRCQLSGHPLGPGRVVVHERGDRVQRVEEKVRLHARFDRRQLRLRGDSACFGFVALLGAERQRGGVQLGAHHLIRGDQNAERQRDDDRDPQRAGEPVGEHAAALEIADRRQDRNREQTAGCRDDEHHHDHGRPVQRKCPAAPDARAEPRHDRRDRRADAEREEQRDRERLDRVPPWGSPRQPAENNGDDEGRGDVPRGHPRPVAQRPDPAGGHSLFVAADAPEPGALWQRAGREPRLRLGHLA